MCESLCIFPRAHTGPYVAKSHPKLRGEYFTVRSKAKTWCIIVSLNLFVVAGKAIIPKQFMVQRHIRIMDVLWCQPHRMVHDIARLTVTSLTQAAINRFSFCNIRSSATMPPSALIERFCILLCHSNPPI